MFGSIWPFFAHSILVTASIPVPTPVPAVHDFSAAVQSLRAQDDTLPFGESHPVVEFNAGEEVFDV